MLYFRSCPRCKTGTIELDRDFYGPFLTCLNCGFSKSGVTIRRVGAARNKPSMAPPSLVRRVMPGRVAVEEPAARVAVG